MGERKQNVKLFSLSTCPACGKMRKLLDAGGVKYECIELDTIANEDFRTATMYELKRYNPQETVPTLIIEQIFVGFDERTVKEALGLK